MNDHNRSKEDLIRELTQLRSRLAETEHPSTSPPPKIKHLTALTEAAESLLGAHDLPSLWPLLKTAANNILQPDRLAVYLYDAENDSLSCPYSFGLSQSYINWINESFHDVPGSALLYRIAPVVVEDVQNEQSFSQQREALLKEGVRTFAVFPLITNKGAIAGALTLYWNEIRPLPPTDISTGHALAHMVALAMNTILLFSQTHQSLLREKSLGEISRTINVAPNLPTLLNSIIKMVAEVVQADCGMIGLVIDRDIMTFYPHNIPRRMGLRPAPRPRGLAWQIVDTCNPIIISEYQTHPDAMQKWVDEGVTHFIGVPLQAGENCLGMLALFNLNYSKQEFHQRDLNLVESVGRQVGTAIQNLRLLAETQQRATAMAAALNRQAELDVMKNNFTQSVSHELRSPLGIIYGHAELLTSESLGSLNEDQQQSGKVIMRRVLMLTNLVDDLTTLLAAETQELRREEIDTVLLIYSLLADYRIRAAELDIHLEAEIEEPMPWLHGDSTHLRRVFDNLVSNAFKFTPAGGKITLRLKAVGEDVCFEVADNGEGIAEDKLGRIFERFYQIVGGSKRRHKGTGLGLSLVKEIVEAHRGTVKVESQLGIGTTFTITIPGYISE
ncbi:MAG: GAF domain-containing protein [Chloroflexi bacterium]|nr:GAF domain-containing protein [Chloroflexota bacterium]